MRIAGLVEHPAHRGGLGVLHAAGLNLLAERFDTNSASAARSPTRSIMRVSASMSRNWGVHVRPSSPAMRWRSSAIASVTSALGAPSSASARQLPLTSSVAGKRECPASGSGGNQAGQSSESASDHAKREDTRECPSQASPPPVGVAIEAEVGRRTQGEYHHKSSQTAFTHHRAPLKRHRAERDGTERPGPVVTAESRDCTASLAAHIPPAARLAALRPAPATRPLLRAAPYRRRRADPPERAAREQQRIIRRPRHLPHRYEHRQETQRRGHDG